MNTNSLLKIFFFLVNSFRFESFHQTISFFFLANSQNSSTSHLLQRLVCSEILPPLNFQRFPRLFCSNMIFYYIVEFKARLYGLFTRSETYRHNFFCVVNSNLFTFGSMRAALLPRSFQLISPCGWLTLGSTQGDWLPLHEEERVIQCLGVGIRGEFLLA